MPEISLLDWKPFLIRHPDAHVLQTGEWGELKSTFGWKAVRLACGQLGVQILFHRLLPGFTLAYIPKGPVGQPTGEFWQEVDRICHLHRAVLLKLEPDLWDDPLDLEPARRLPGFRPSPHNIQPRRTIIVDLRGSEDDLLVRMKQKCRYNIRLAEKKSIAVRPWADLDGFHRMITVTGGRDGFGVHSAAYYRRAYDLFHAASLCELLVAEYKGKPLAALMVFVRGKRAWYLFGASTDEERNRMPTYLLQWEAMRWAKCHGAQEYDLWGVPDEDKATLEANFETRHDGLWGVYRFKRGFGGEVKRAVGAIDRVYDPLLYRFYLWRFAGRSNE